MKKEIKRTPITYNGEDGFEVLIEDNVILMQDACNYCMYNEWDGWEECAASCSDVHRCGIGTSTYFKFIK